MLYAALTQAGIARLNAASATYSGAFLQALPCSATGTRLDDTSIRIAIATRLGAPVCMRSSQVYLWSHCRSTHLELMDSVVENLPGVVCNRHSALIDLIKRSLTTAEIPSRLELTSLFRSDGKRPDGLSLMPWKQGRCLVCDVTCPDTLAQSHLNRAWTGSGFVATDAESRKHIKYEIISLFRANSCRYSGSSG